MADVHIELLEKTQDRRSFDCGKPAQNDFLKQRARKHAELNYSKTWVAVEAGADRILGFITLSMGNVAFENLDEQIGKRLPRYPMPVLHVGQLATDLTCQGRGIGSLLLGFAARKAIEASDSLGRFAIELIADSAEAFDYYLRRGFNALCPGSMRLYQSIDALRAAIRLAESADPQPEDR